MRNILFENIIWKKLENRKIKLFSIIGIFFFYLIYHLSFYVNRDMEIPFLDLILVALKAMAVGIFGAGILLWGLYNIELNKNKFLNRYDILNFDYFMRCYVLCFLIIIPLGLVGNFIHSS